jgi:hypothetical protein
MMNATTGTHLPHSFRRIRLELAREHDHPLGSGAYGYDFLAPLLADGRIDPEAWRSFKEVCRAVRHRPGEDREIGHLVRRPGGSWAFRYTESADEAGYHFGEERFRAGEYVSVREDNGEHTFKVTSVEPL